MNRNYVIRDTDGKDLRHVTVPEEEIENQLAEGETFEEISDARGPAASPIF